MMVEELSSETFQQHLSQPLPVVVDFWAPWCGPCKELAPIFEKVSVEYNNKLRFAKINVDDNQSIAQEFGIRGIPCLVVFHNGEEIDRLVGGMSEQELRSKLDLALTKA